MVRNDLKHRIQHVLNRTLKVSDRKKRIGYSFMDHRERPTAYESAWLIPAGYSFAHLKRQYQNLSAACGYTVELEDRGGVVIVRVVTEDLPKVIPLNESDFRPGKLLIGYNRIREPVYHPLFTHLLMGGASGAGKTDALRFIIYQLILQGYDVRVVDMKGFSFMPFDTVPGLSVARNLTEAVDMLGESFLELLDREKRVIRHRNRDVIQSFQPIAVIIDEAAQIAPKQNSGDDRKLAKLCDEYCAKISQKGREPRVNLIYCTQRPDHEVINPQVKANVEAAIAFRCKTRVNSEIILDHGGAQEIPLDAPGRCIYSGIKEMTVHVPYVGDDDAWNTLLMSFKTEVVNGGSSSRRAQGAVYGPSSDYSADRESIRQLESIQARIGDSIYTPKREVGRESADGQYAKDMAAIEEGPGTDGVQAYSDTVE